MGGRGSFRTAFVPNSNAFGRQIGTGGVGYALLCRRGIEELLLVPFLKQARQTYPKVEILTMPCELFARRANRVKSV